MTFKLSEAALQHVVNLFHDRLEAVTIPTHPIFGGHRRSECVCPLHFEEDRAVLAELLDRTPPEALYMGDHGLALNREWLRGLLKFNGHDPDHSTSRKAKAAEPPPSRPDLKVRRQETAKPSSALTTPSPSPSPAPALAPMGASLFEPGRRRRKADWIVSDATAIAVALNLNPDMKSQRRAMLTRLKERPERMLPRVTDRHLRSLDALEVQMPNFSRVIEHIRNHLVLLKLTRAPLALPPLLLLGPPGVGKTHFAKAISKSLGLHLHIRSMAETSAAFVFIGTHSSWGSAQVGAVARLVMETPDRLAPVLVVDEVDKVQRGNFSPDHVLLGLLEPNTARHFRDEYLDIEIDVRPLSILLTANQPLPSGSPLATRVTTLEVGLPTAAEMPGIVRAVDAQVREDKPGIAHLFQPLSDQMVSAISECAPRAMRVRLMQAYALAAREANARGGRCGRGSLSIDSESFDPSVVRSADASTPEAPRHRKHVAPLLVLDFSLFQRLH